MRHLLHPPAAWRDLALLAARLLVGTVLVVHGWDKLTGKGPAATAAMFEHLHIPLPGAAAWFAIAAELGAGALLIVGLLTPLAGVLAALNMAGAWWFVHRGHGVLLADKGWEFVGVIAAVCLALAGAGAGRLSLDGLLARGATRPASSAAAPAPAGTPTTRAERHGATRAR